jgi:DNA phosphorothioation-associated putative methyltransferase
VGLSNLINQFDAVEIPWTERLAAIAMACKGSSVGKRLPDALYVHMGALSSLDPLLQEYEAELRIAVENFQAPTLVKFGCLEPKLSYLFYPSFDTDPHPALHRSIQVNCTSGQVTQRDYSAAENPFILHRKETFVTPDYPHYQKFAILTQQEEALGLLDDPRQIGTLAGWRSRLQAYRVEIQNHRVVQLTSTHSPKIDRHKAAISRSDYSKPVRLALEAGLLNQGTTFFDYGCGQGGDIERLTKLGYESSGWDPYYRADTTPQAADIVNLGYVINVIEDPAERREALLKAWALTQSVLIVAAQVLIDNPGMGQVAYSDGILTRRNTFQKYFDQEELKTYIDQVLGVDAIPVALGIYLVFRDQGQAQSFRASRFRSRVTTPRMRVGVRRFEEYKELLSPLMAFFAQQGRLPVKDELPTESESELIRQFGTLKRAFQVILQVTDVQEWDAIADKRRQDLLVYLALSHFGRRPRYRELPEPIQNDVKGLFGSYQQACVAADLMLTSLGEPGFIAACCQRSAIGRLTSSGLSVHISALEELDPLLRLYEGCASRTIGRMAEATVIKFHSQKPKISYLFYPDFDIDPHPRLHTSMQIDLRDLQVSYRDYEADQDCPILHWKEAYVSANYPHREKFAKLTHQEQIWGLLDEPRAIATYKGWQRRLAENCAELRGHRVVWRRDANPYRVKILRSAQRLRASDERNAEPHC